MKNLILLISIFLMSETTMAQDWPNLSRFQKENAQLGQPAKGEERIVFMGNSITEQWINLDPEFFAKNKLINRGIGGQTTPQMLLRFRQDVIDLHPKAVIILAGINDIAGNTGPSTLKMIEDNFQSMAELAKVSGIHVILCSLLPSNKIPWRNNQDPSTQIDSLNQWLLHFAKTNSCVYVDYFSKLADSEKGLPEKYSKDGVHPTIEGYHVMEKIIIPYIEKIRKK